MRIVCPSCSEEQTFDDALAGQVVNCAKCGSSMLLPALALPAEKAPPAPPCEKEKQKPQESTNSSQQNPSTPPPKAGFVRGCIATLCLITFIVCIPILIYASCHPVGGNGEKDSNAAQAAYYAEQFVKQRIKSPSTAKFEKFPENHGGVTKIGDKYVVDSYVDSQNGFGATVRTYFTVTLHQSGGNWKLDDIQLQ